MTGCRDEQKYSVWTVGGPADRTRSFEYRGLDRASCEVVRERLEKNRKEAADYILRVRKDLKPLETVRFSCESD